MHMYTVFFQCIVIVFVGNYHNMVKKYCMHMLTTLLVSWETEALHEMLSVCAPLVSDQSFFVDN